MILLDTHALIQKLPMLHAVGITAEIAARSVAFPRTYPSDPADRIIGATAKVLNYPLATRDEPIKRSRAVPTLW